MFRSLVTKTGKVSNEGSIVRISRHGSLGSLGLVSFSCGYLNCLAQFDDQVSIDRETSCLARPHQGAIPTLSLKGSLLALGI